MPVRLIVDGLTHFAISALRNVIQTPLHKENRFKVAHTSFLVRGVDHHRASRVRNMSDGGASFFYQNKYGGTQLFLPKVTFVLLETKFAYKGGFTCWNNFSQFCEFKKNCFYQQSNVSQISKETRSIMQPPRTHSGLVKHSKPRICVKILQSKPRRLSLTTTTTVKHRHARRSRVIF